MKIDLFFVIVLQIISILYVSGEPSLASYDRDADSNGEALTGYTPQGSRWYIEKSTGKCKEFNYLGKGLDFNNFKSENECEEHKMFTLEEKIAECDRIITTGTVFQEKPPASICEKTYGKIRYYLRKENLDHLGVTYTCEAFEYKGCGTTPNNFHTYDDCWNICMLVQKNDFKPIKEHCKAEITTFSDADGYQGNTAVIADLKSGKCVHTTVSTDQLSKKGVFKSLTACVNLCFEENLEFNPKCKNGAHQGKCSGKLTTRFYYDKFSRRCVSYIAEECPIHDNENSFETMNDCIGTCPSINELNDSLHPVRATNLCQQGVDLGEGQLFLTRYYYDDMKKSCLPFIYKGIGGNDNRFDSELECEAACTGKKLSLSSDEYFIEDIPAGTQIENSNDKNNKIPSNTTTIVAPTQPVKPKPSDDPELPDYTKEYY